MSAEPIPILEPERPHLTLVEKPKYQRPTKPCERCGEPKPRGHGRRLCENCADGKWREPKPLECRECGGPREPRKQMCADCKELADWKYKTRHRLARGRQPCSRCGGPKGPGQRRRLCDACTALRDSPRRCERCGEPKVTVPRGKRCDDCKAEVKAAARARRNEAQRQARLDPVKGERIRELGRASYWRRRTDPARHKEMLEVRRINHRLKVEREKGQHIDTLKRERTALGAFKDAAGKTDRLLDAAPLVAWIDQAERLFEDRKEMGRVLDINERTLYEVGRQPTVTLGVADRALWNLNRVLTVPGYGDVASVQDLWPELA